MKDLNLTDPIGQNTVKLISNACFSVFVFSVLIFTVIAITYQPPDPWESARALTKAFTDVENATFKNDDSVLKTGEDIASAPVATPVGSPMPVTEASLDRTEKELEKNVTLKSGCEDVSVVNCSDPRVLIAIKRFNMRNFKAISFLQYGIPVNGSNPDECDVSWRFRNKKEKSWRRYRDFRRFKIGFTDDCSYKVMRPGRWHSGLNARRPRIRGNSTGNKGNVTKFTPTVRDDEINDTIAVLGSDSAFRKGKYLYYSRGGDSCKNMNHYIWSFLCALGEARYLNRTFVMDLNVCMASTYTLSKKDEEGKDFRFYFDFEHLKESSSIVEKGEFLKDWKKWDNSHKSKIPVKNVASYKVTPKQLMKDKSTIIYRHFDGPEPENYWYRVCEGPAANYIKRPWQALWKSKRLMNIVSAISGSMDWDFDAVHVVRGEKAQNKEQWPNLDADTSPDAIVAKLQGAIAPWRNLYVATNEPFYNYFDKLRSHYKVHLLDDYKYLWSNASEWYNETTMLNGGRPVEFDGYMRVAVDTEVLYRSKTKAETFYNLTRDCKDGINTC